MNSYEVAFIIQPTIDEEGVSGLVAKVKGYIEAVGGEISETDLWGRRTLAYPIRNYREGYYAILHANIDPASIKDIERNMRFTEEIIRYLVIRAES